MSKEQRMCQWFIEPIGLDKMLIKDVISQRLKELCGLEDPAIDLLASDNNNHNVFAVPAYRFITSIEENIGEPDSRIRVWRRFGEKESLKPRPPFNKRIKPLN